MSIMKKENSPQLSEKFTKTGKRAVDEMLLQPYDHLKQLQDDTYYDQLAKAANTVFKIDEEKISIIKEIFIQLANSVTLLDDIEDNSVLRRGAPTAHTIYGIPSTLTATLYVSIAALEKCLQLNHPEARAICIEAYLGMLSGQGLDVYYRENFTCPTEEEYLDIAHRKVGSLTLMAVRLMQLFSQNKSDFSKVCSLSGIYYQIIGDYANLFSKKYAEKKGYCDDITEGKFSFPIVHAIHTQPNNFEIMNILKLRTRDKALKKRCVSLLEKYGSLKYTRMKLIQLYQEIIEEFKDLGCDFDVEDLINNLDISTF